MTNKQRDKHETAATAVGAFVELMRAWERGDLSAAAEAQGDLARLGVRVRVKPIGHVAGKVVRDD